MNNTLFKIYLRLFDAGTLLGCHQKPERSFIIGNWQFPVCARCTGVLAGQLSAVFFILSGRRTTLRLDMSFLGIMFTDWFIQHLKILESNNMRRFLTGFLAGIGLVGIYFKAVLFFLDLLLTTTRRV